MPLNSVEAGSIPTQRGLFPSVRALLDFLAQECAARCQFGEPRSRMTRARPNRPSVFASSVRYIERIPAPAASSRIKRNAALKTSGEALRQAVTPKRLNDKIDEHARLGR